MKQDVVGNNKELKRLVDGLDTTPIDEHEKIRLVLRYQQLELLPRDKQVTDEQRAIMAKMMGACFYFIFKEAKKIHDMMLQKKITVTMVDLVHSGLEALYPAVTKFETEKNVSFLTYANWWFRQYIQKQALSEGWIVKDGYGWRCLKNTIGVVRLDEIRADMSHTSNEAVVDQLQSESSDDPQFQLYNKNKILTLHSSYLHASFDSMFNKFVIRDILAASSQLSIRERFIFETSSYGPVSYAEIGRLMELSRERVRLIYKRSRRKVDELLHEQSTTKLHRNEFMESVCIEDGCKRSSLINDGGNAFRCQQCFELFLNNVKQTV